MLRASLRCSNPNCRRLTAAYNSRNNKIVCIGEGAHIRTNSEGGPRYVPEYDASKIENGIWLCATCHTLIDKDSINYNITLLEKWKTEAETNNYSLLEDAKTDMFNYFVNKEFKTEDFNCSTASDLQLLIIFYAISEGCNVKICNNYLDEGDSEKFLEFY